MSLSAQTAEEIIYKMEHNESFSSIYYEGVMSIHRGKNRPVSVKTFKVFSSGKDRTFIEFTNPADRGTKYLKIKDELWIKGPYAEEATKISGHLLRENMAGSDFSYEDALENEKLLELYEPYIEKEEIVNERNCYRIVLKSKIKNISYPKRIVWVDKEKFFPVKVELYALSGVLLKEMNVVETLDISGYTLPVKIRMENKQRIDNWTFFEMKSVKINIPLDSKLFSKQQLER